MPLQGYQLYKLRAGFLPPHFARAPQTSRKNCDLENTPSSLPSSLGRSWNSSPSCTLSSGFSYLLRIAGIDGCLAIRYGSDTPSSSCKLTKSCISKRARKNHWSKWCSPKQTQVHWPHAVKACTCSESLHMQLRELFQGHGTHHRTSGNSLP